MRTEDLLAAHNKGFAAMSGVEKQYHAYGYVEGVNKPERINEAKLKEQLTERISKISEIFEADDITATVYGNAIRFGLDFEGYKVKFVGGIVSYRDETRIGSGAYTYLFDVEGKAEVYDGDKLIHTYQYAEKDFEAEFIYDEMSYFGCKESDF